ncbi:hypothetical protein [Streptomyces californicus]|uniref:hypothetical protein n=1 Tax=Streptomyces californicus TaxID=67351 RepID=UPI0004BFCF71|nr:hypothetical protein [Streptomyces californicus]QRV59365.1 hypothetical protein I6J40_34455 [Streptomyces californicus]
MTEREQKIGDILDGLGVALDMDDGDLIASALVIAKVIDADGDAHLAMMTSDGLSWIEQNGLLASAQQVVSQRHVDRKGDDE